MLAHGASSWPQPPGKILADQDDWRRRRRVRDAKVTPFEQRNLHGGQETWRDHTESGGKRGGIGSGYANVFLTGGPQRQKEGGGGAGGPRGGAGALLDRESGGGGKRGDLGGGRIIKKKKKEDVEGGDSCEESNTSPIKCVG